MQYTITIVDGYVQTTSPIETNAAYMDMVCNMAALSYATQYGTATSDEGITAAREAFNASLPAPVEPVE